MKRTPFSLVFLNDAYRDHEQVIFCRDREAELMAIIAIHDTTLGPGLGGTRMWPYETETAALRDALRLSQGMTRKNALAGLALGGAKAVIVGDSRTAKSERLLTAYARHVARLGGTFITGEDVGMGVADMDVIAAVTEHVRGTSASRVGDPSPFTALGVLKGMEAAVRHRLERANLEGVTVCVQGLGHVGMALAQLLHEQGAKLTVADIRAESVTAAVEAFGAEPIAADRAHAAEVDVLAPCALGAILNERTIPDIHATVVAGSANNQLEAPADGARLAARGILYAPDYAINAGGVIAIAHDTPDYTPDALRADIERIAGTLAEIFTLAQKDARPTSAIADDMAEERLEAGRAGRGR